MASGKRTAIEKALKTDASESEHGHGMIIQILSRKTTALAFLPFVSLVESEHLLISASKVSTSSALCCRIEWVLGFWHFHLVYNLRPPFIIAQDFPRFSRAKKDREISPWSVRCANAVDDDDDTALNSP